MSYRVGEKPSPEFARLLACSSVGDEIGRGGSPELPDRGQCAAVVLCFWPSGEHYVRCRARGETVVVESRFTSLCDGSRRLVVEPRCADHADASRGIF